MSETSKIPQEEHPNAAQLQSATKGFDHLFSNEIVEARVAFTAEESPFHLLGLGVCTFLEAALGMESAMMTEATRCLTLSEAGARKQQKYAKGSATQRFPPGVEWEILNADAVVLLGLTHALSESYMGYFQCMYSLNRLYKTVFPTGLNNYRTPAASPAVSRKSSNPSLNSISLSLAPISSKSSIFGRWSGSTLTVPPPTPAGPPDHTVVTSHGPVEELIVAGTAFGFGLFNLVFSLLPKKIQSVVGFFGFKHDRKQALQALAVSAAMKDVHSVFAGLVLMTYYGVVLLLSGYQADESHILKQYKAMVDSIESRYPMGALWILNRAKILRMSHDADSAIRVLRDGLKHERPHTFAQADTLLVFELAWTLLSQGRYQESAEMFTKMTELNNWSHATYYYIAAGCYIALQNYTKAKELFDTIPNLIDRRKINGKELPTEVLIKKKLEFYREKQRRRGGVEAEYVEAIKISPANEIAIFWNTYTRVEKSVAESHIKQWAALSPPVTIQSPYINPAADAPTGPVDLDTSDELALRSLLLGIVHRSIGDYEPSRAFLTDAHKRLPEIKVSTWIGGVALFELAVLDLKETDAAEKLSVSDVDGLDQTRSAWVRALKSASDKLDQAMALDSNSTDLSSRLDSRITMLRDEIGTKRETLGLV